METKTSWRHRYAQAAKGTCKHEERVINGNKTRVMPEKHTLYEHESTSVKG